MGFLKGKRVLIVGLASNRSIAFGVADAMHQQGAELAFSYQNDKLKPRVEKMATEWGSSLTFECDLGDDNSIEKMFEQLTEHWDGLDVIVHSAAFAPAGQLDGNAWRARDMNWLGQRGGYVHQPMICPFRSRERISAE